MVQRGVLRVQSNVTEALAQACVAQLQLGKSSVFSKEIVVVQRPGMDRWLTQYVAGHAGLAWDFRSIPLRNLWLEVAQASPLDPAPLRWVTPSRLRFAILEELMALDERPVWASIVEHTCDVHRAVQLASRQAALYELYLDERPHRLAQWEQGEEPEDWQAELWRILLARKAARNGDALVSPVALRESLLKWMHEPEPSSTESLLAVLGPRVHFFGFTDRSASSESLVQALGLHLRVGDYRLLPSQEFLGDCQEEHPLLHAWSRGYCKQSAQPSGLEGADESTAREQHPIFLDRNAQSPERSDLEILQSSFLKVQSEGLEFRVDDSIQIHGCWGPLREVEVLQDRIAQALLEFPEWSYEDIVVWVSDLPSYAPWIEAVFSPVKPAPGPTIPYRIVDAHQAPLEPSFLVLFELLASFQERATQGRLLEIMSLEPVRCAFEWSDEQLHHLSQGIQEAQIRWGQNAQDRARSGQPGVAANSWEQGLDRWALGRAYQCAPWGDEPLVMADEATLAFVGPARVEDATLGQLARFLDAYFEAKELALEAATLGEWSRRCLGWMELFLPQGSERPATQALELCLSTLVEDEQNSGAQPQLLDLESFGLLLEAVSQGASSGALWGRGGVTFAQLQSARPVPANMVALLGMGQGQFPRNLGEDSWSLRVQEPMPGELSTRDQDRIAMMESMLCARSRWICLYSSRDPQGESHSSPSPLVQELREFLRGHRGSVTRDFEVEHPLNPQSPSAWRVQDPRLVGQRKLDWQVAVQSEKVLREGGAKTREAIQTPLAGPPADEGVRDVVQLRDLLRFFRASSASMLRNGLGVWVGDEERHGSDQEPGFLAELQRYGVEDELLSGLLARDSRQEQRRRLLAQGCLPWGAGGDAALSLLSTDLQGLASEVLGEVPQGLGQKAIQTWSGVVQLGTRQLQGQVRGPTHEGWLWRVRPASLKPKSIFSAWIEHLFLSAMSAQDYAGTRLLGRKRERGKTQTLRCAWRPLCETNAQGHLAVLLKIFSLGHRWPLPLFLKAGHQYASLAQQGKKTPAEMMGSAQQQFRSDFGAQRSEAQQDWATQLLFEEDQALLSRKASRALGEVWPQDWDPELSDFAALSLAMWTPCLEEMED